MLESPNLSRTEIIKKEIEEAREGWEAEEEKEWHSKRIFKEMKEGRMSFWDLRKAYLNREIKRYQLEEIISFGLKESDGSLKRLLPIFKIKEEDYKKFLNFLHAQGITLQNLKNSDQSQNRSDYSQEK